MIKLGPLPDGPLGVAVSGGGDSIALLMLLHNAGRDVRVATVDHRLRPEAAAEARGVAGLCQKLGVPHKTLAWDAPATTGNLQKAARDARRRLLADWARAETLRDIALGHTLDDQAETVLMRLARGSGVDGLAGMAARRCENGLCWHRPLLAVQRAELRAYLDQIGVAWIDDPSNEDLRFDRIKARRTLAALAPLGLEAKRLAETAAHMRRARIALEIATQDLARSCVSITVAGELSLGLGPFENAPREIQLRLLSAGLGWVASARYRPRFSSLEGLLASCFSEQNFTKTLHGCVISKKNDTILINREPAATPAPALAQSVWDGRWEIDTKAAKNLEIRALGEDGLNLCPNWRESGHSRRALLASPSFWQKGVLLAAPLAQFGHIGSVEQKSGEKGFYKTLITH